MIPSSFSIILTKQ